MSYMLELKYQDIPFTLQAGLEVAFDINNPVVRKAIIEMDARIVKILKEVLVHQTWIDEMLDEQKSVADFNRALIAVKKRWAER